MSRRTITVPAARLGLVLLLAACAAPTVSPPAASPPPASEPPPPSSQPPATGGGEAVTVIIRDTSFGDDITVATGTPVIFTNEDGFAHTVTEGTDGLAAPDARFDEDVAGGATVVVTFDRPGSHNVTCKIHPVMNMTVDVEG